MPVCWFVRKSSSLIVIVDVNSAGTGSSPLTTNLLIFDVSENTVLLYRSSPIRPISWRLLSGIVGITFGGDIGITVVSC